jgi:hypothetical protein
METSGFLVKKKRNRNDMLGSLTPSIPSKLQKSNEDSRIMEVPRRFLSGLEEQANLENTIVLVDRNRKLINNANAAIDGCLYIPEHYEVLLKLLSALQTIIALHCKRTSTKHYILFKDLKTLVQKQSRRYLNLIYLNNIELESFQRRDLVSSYIWFQIT